MTGGKKQRAAPATPKDLLACAGYVARDMVPVLAKAAGMIQRDAVGLYVLAGVVEFARLSKTYFESMGNIAKALGLTKKQVKDSLRHLKADGIVTRTGRHGAQLDQLHWWAPALGADPFTGELDFSALDEGAADNHPPGRPQPPPGAAGSHPRGGALTATPTKETRASPETIRDTVREEEGARPAASLSDPPLPDCAFRNSGEEDAPGEAVGNDLDERPKASRVRAAGARPKGPKAIDESPESDVPPPADGEAAKAHSLLAETVRTACLRHETYMKKGLVHAFFDIRKALGLGDRRFEQLDFSKAGKALKTIAKESPNGLPGQEGMIDFLVWCFSQDRVPDYVGDLECFWLQYQPEVQAAAAERQAAEAAKAAADRLAEDLALVADTVERAKANPDAKRLMDVVSQADLEERVRAARMLRGYPAGLLDMKALAAAAEAHGPREGLTVRLMDIIEDARDAARAAKAKRAV